MLCCKCFVIFNWHEIIIQQYLILFFFHFAYHLFFIFTRYKNLVVYNYFKHKVKAMCIKYYKTFRVCFIVFGKETCETFYFFYKNGKKATEEIHLQRR